MFHARFLGAKPIMKFNERNVAYFANCNSPVDKEGLLLKRGELHKGFHKRWFILKGNLLFYFEKKGDKDPVGVIILEGCRVELADSEDSMFTFQISFPGDGARTYVLAAFDQEEMEAWMRAVSCSSYDYMKAMVDELQRQLDELTHHTHGDGIVQQGRFSYAPGGSEDLVLLGAEGSDNSKGIGIYERGKTESLAHRGAPRPNAFQRNSLPHPVNSQFSNPSYAIWDPLVPKEEDEDNLQGTESASSSTQFHVSISPPANNDSSDDDYSGESMTEREKFMGKSAQLAQQVQLNAVQSRQPSTAPGAQRDRSIQAKSVFYENVMEADVSKPITRGVSARARLVNKFGGQSSHNSGVESKKTGQSIFHDNDIRSFREMHEQFGLLIVKKINEARQRKMSST